ncbi:MAG: cadherin repeat domain-containing protein, partial [Alphaproteobacteria bacterium]|nr:cadherin repeat domain-containing protein [Alphaproteobacteria bacterium]
MFDTQFYLSANPDVAQMIEDGVIASAAEHFITIGFGEGRSPSSFFDVHFYLTANPDVAAAVEAGQTSAFEHFLDHGGSELRAPSPFFDPKAYLDANSDLQTAADEGLITPLQHFLAFGIQEARDLGNGIGLNQFRNDPTFIHAIEAGDVQAALERVADVAPFLPGFVPPAGYIIPEDIEFPMDFVPRQGVLLVVPEGVTPPPNLPPIFEDPDAPPPPGPVNTPPSGASLPAGTTIAENASVGTVIGTLTSTDPEGKPVTYALINDAGGKFAVDPTTGVLTVAGPLDYETSTSHTFRVSVSDGKTTNASSVTVGVTDVAEGPNAPTISASAVDENSSGGTAIGTVSAFSPDAGATLTYSLTDDAGGRFEIDSVTGALTVATGAVLDYEAATSHDIVAQVSDGTFNAASTLTITLNDVNESPAAPALASGGSILEGSPAGSAVATISAADTDAGTTLTYTLTDDAGGRFEIDSVTGALTVATGAVLDYEAATSHDITVQASDGTFTVDSTLTITVDNANESPTVPTLASGGSILEGSADGSAVATISATDPDAGTTLTYSLTDDAGGRFAINASTGVVTLASGGPGVDYDDATSHDISVRVSDGALYTEDTFTITVNERAEGVDDTAAATEDGSNVNISAASLLAN